MYGVKDGKPDLTNLVATKDLDVNLNGLTTLSWSSKKGVADNTKKIRLMFQLHTWTEANSCPFTAGVNQVIPYEFFAGDSMLTRLILKSQTKAHGQTSSS